MATGNELVGQWKNEMFQGHGLITVKWGLELVLHFDQVVSVSLRI